MPEIEVMNSYLLFEEPHHSRLLVRVSAFPEEVSVGIRSVKCEAPLPPVGDGVIHDRLPGPGVNEGLRVVRHHDVIIPATGPLA